MNCTLKKYYVIRKYYEVHHVQSHASAPPLLPLKVKMAARMPRVKTLSRQIDLNMSRLYLKRMLCLSQQMLKNDIWSLQG